MLMLYLFAVHWPVFTIKHHQGLKACLTTFQVDLVNLLGGEHQRIKSGKSPDFTDEQNP